MESGSKNKKTQLIYFIRHAESENNVKQCDDKVKYKLIREADPPITKRGEVQVKACISYLKKKSIIPTKMFASCNKRAIQTADLFQQEFKNHVQIKQHICEMGYCYDYNPDLTIIPRKGMGKSEFQKTYPQFSFDESIPEEGWNPLTEKESKQDMNQRASNLMDFIKDYVKQLIDAEQEETVVVITHGLFFDSVLGVIFDRKEDSEYKFNTKMTNTGISCFEIDYEGRVNLKYVNDYNHLLDWCMDKEIQEQAAQVDGINPEIKVTGMK